MKRNVTLSAEEHLIEKAREQARKQNTTLNALFRDWLSRLVSTGSTERGYADVMERLSYAKSGGSFSRDEMHER